MIVNTEANEKLFENKIKQQTHGKFNLKSIFVFKFEKYYSKLLTLSIKIDDNWFILNDGVFSFYAIRMILDKIDFACNIN